MRMTKTMYMTVCVAAVIIVVVTVMVVPAQIYRSPEVAKSGAIVGVSLAPSRRNSI